MANARRPVRQSSNIDMAALSSQANIERAHLLGPLGAPPAGGREIDLIISSASPLSPAAADVYSSVFSQAHAIARNGDALKLRERDAGGWPSFAAGGRLISARRRDIGRPGRGRACAALS